MISHPDNQTFILDNGLIRRIVISDRCGLHTSSFINSQSGTELAYAPGSEFSLVVDNKKLRSFSTPSVNELDGTENSASADFSFEGSGTEKFADGSQALNLRFRHDSKLAVTVSYRIYPGIAGIRKHLELTNISDKNISIERLIIDNMTYAPGTPGACRTYFDLDRETPVCFASECTEDIIRVHNHQLDEGVFIGSSIPGVLRYFLYFPHWSSVSCSYNQGGAFFRKELVPQEVFTTCDSLIAVYSGKFEDASCPENYRRLVRANLPALPAKEGVMYCTWLPFLRNISDELISELVPLTREMGFDYLVIDDGWFKEKSDWQTDEEKFPSGLEAVSEKTRNAGLKFGLWFNIGTDYGAIAGDDRLAVRSSNGDIKYSSAARDRKVMCFGSEYRYYITEKLSELAEKYHVSYFKLDFSAITSPYNFTEWGCHSTEHCFHKNYNDSFTAMYEGMMYLRKTLKKRFPDLIVDFSFEAFGTARPGAAALEYSELHHVSNFSALKTAFQQIHSVRRSFYSWLGVLPCERILNGLLSIQSDEGVEYFLTSLAGAPLVAGDLRKLSPRVKERITKCCAAFKKVTDKGALTAFEVVCNTFEHDGFIRKSDDGRAILCLFNRTDEVWKPEFPGFINAENGKDSVEVPPHDCAMFTKI